MIELNITPELKIKHGNLFLGKNKKYKNRLYTKLFKLVELEKQIVQKRIFKWVLDNFEDLILGDIKVLSLSTVLFDRYLKSIAINNRKEIIEKLKIFHDEYDYFKDATEWNAYKFQRELAVTVCPYCNSQFVMIYESTEGGRTRATLDHFFDKASYPFLAVSLFNLVPSCKVCNSDLKNKKKVGIETHYSPYELGVLDNLIIKRVIVKQEDLIFKIDSKEDTDYVSSILGINDDFNILFEHSSEDTYFGRKIKGNIDLFHLDKLYNEYHKGYVQDLIKKAIIYNEAYLQQLTSSNSIIFQNTEMLQTALFASKTNDKNRILGKLTRDVIENELKNGDLKNS
ncbi:hypothetical protein [Lysinibacillus capsici]|uniref:hypothetical protein n=1 Tax=Lysinibacillus capsici TaxID=2115968 RepID=UPI00325FC829